jgi:hypothetical protein
MLPKLIGTYGGTLLPTGQVFIALCPKGIRKAAAKTNKHSQAATHKSIWSITILRPEFPDPAPRAALFLKHPLRGAFRLLLALTFHAWNP